MGQNSKEETSDTVASLFSVDNPFRRKPVCGLEENPSADCSPPLEKKKRKRDKKNTVVDSTDAKVLKKRKDGNDGDEAVGSPKKKRKRHEMEEEKHEVEKNVEERSGLGVAVGMKRKAEDENKSMVVSNEPFDDESKLLRTVFVGNLPLKTKRKVLLKEFGTFGEIESVRIRSVPLEKTKAPRKSAILKGKINDAIDRVNAYVVFKDEQSAQAALGHNMAMIEGNHIRVDKACPPRKKLKGEAPIYSVKKTVFVGNLPFDVNDEELYQLFCDANQSESGVEAVRVVRDPKSSVGKGIAYVLFKTREAANSVVKKELKLRNRILRLSHAAKPDATPSKRKLPDSRNIGSNKKAAIASGETDYKPKVKADSLSYQGLRSSKTGVHKKVPRSAVRVKSTAGATTAKMAEKKPRTTKRPAVAARKANSLKQAEKKRKLENRTPETTPSNKRARHFK